MRDFGQTFDFWEDNLTMQRLAGMQESLAERPTLTDFARLYFMGREWWFPPSMRGEKQDDMPECTLPEYEP